MTFSPRTIVVWWIVLGSALWLAGQVVTEHPTFAAAAGLATLLFSALFVAAGHHRTAEHSRSGYPLPDALVGSNWSRSMPLTPIRLLRAVAVPGRNDNELFLKSRTRPSGDGSEHSFSGICTFSNPGKCC